MAVKIEQIYKDFERSIKKLSKLHTRIIEDFKFVQGKQWREEDVETLRVAGVKALTINKLKPIIKLITGIERQSKSDYVAFPEGQEDGLVADITTALLKNVVKQSRAERKLSEEFKRGVIGGMDFIEAYMDYSEDLIHGKMCLRNINPTQVFFDPDAEEYDLSDAKFIIKFSPNLTKDQLIELHPTKESLIEKIDQKKVDLKDLGTVINHTQGVDYPALNKATGDKEEIENGYDHVEYKYKTWIKKYFVVDQELETVQEVKDKTSGQEYIDSNPNARLIEKKMPEWRVCSIVGVTELDNQPLWCSPRWKSHDIIPYFAEWLTIALDEQELQIQGIVRGCKDLQEEFNKRRTQELRHLNASVNSGMMYADDALAENEEAKLKKFGSSPGITIKYKAGTQGKPERILPVPLSQAHAQLAEENAQDLKEASGVNPDLLANAESDQSGRAILLKQKQGLVMVQEMLDNYSDTKKHLGKFLLSQLGEIYTVETAVKVVGDAFLNKYQEFQKPVMGGEVDHLTGQPLPVIDPMTGQVKTEIDQEAVGAIFNKVLNDPDLGNYDISIGEGAYSETVKMSNYLTLQDMVSKGLPIPPDILIQESMLPQGTKQRIVAALEAAQMAAQAAPIQPPKKETANV